MGLEPTRTEAQRLLRPLRLPFRHLGSSERETGFEPATPTLARSYSTAELFSLASPLRRCKYRGKVDGAKKRQRTRALLQEVLRKRMPGGSYAKKGLFCGNDYICGAFFEQTLMAAKHPGPIAFVAVDGKQLKAAVGSSLLVDVRQQAVGDRVTLEEVLLLWDGKQARVGAPHVAGAKVVTEVAAHAKDGKVVVFKKKRRKGYKVTRGHRQPYTRLLVKEIIQK